MNSCDERGYHPVERPAHPAAALGASPNTVAGTDASRMVARRTARLDVETGAVTALGQAGRWSDPPECFTTGALLACRLDQDRIPVWRRAAA